MCKNMISLSCVFSVILTIGCSKADDTDKRKANAPTFKAPNEAITHYFDGIAKNDVDKILEACAIKEVGENFKYEFLAERLNMMNFAVTLSPANYSFYSEINKADLSSRILSQVKLLCFSLLSSEEVNGTAIFPADSERVNRFVGEINPRRLSDLKIEKISFPLKHLENDANYLEHAMAMAKQNGADESTERLVLFSFGRNYYCIGFCLLRYGQNWKIENQSSSLGGTPIFGTAQKTTIEEFENKLNGN